MNGIDSLLLRLSWLVSACKNGKIEPKLISSNIALNIVKKIIKYSSSFLFESKNLYRLNMSSDISFQLVLVLDNFSPKSFCNSKTNRENALIPL